MKRALVLFGSAGALIAACSLDATGISGQGHGSTGGAPSSAAAGLGGASSSSAGGGGAPSGGGGSGGGVVVPGNADACPGAPIALSPPGITFDATLTGMHDNAIHPSCGPMTGPDMVYAVSPSVTGTLKVTLTSQGGFNKALALRSLCADTSPASELSCDTNATQQPILQRKWVRAGETVYVVVAGDEHDFTLQLELSACGDGNVDELEQCDGTKGCHGCVTCDGPGEIWDGKTGRCYLLKTQPATWANARASCVGWGGDLAGINAQSELDFITNTNDVKNAGDVWIAGYALSDKCAYTWVDGEPWWDGAWADSEPDSNGNDHCLDLYGAKDHLVDDTTCSFSKAYLCERAPAGSCGDGVIQAGEECDDKLDKINCKDCRIVCQPDEFKDPYTHHCYTLITGGPGQLNWDDAKTACEDLGQHLAVISSPEENTLMTQHIGGDTWVDGHWNLIDGWHWDNSDPYCYEHWHSGEPSIGENCLEVYKDGTWNNQSCGDKRDYVCEREP